MTVRPVTAIDAADSWPPLSSDTTLEIVHGPCAEIVIADRGQDRSVGATKAAIADVHTDASGNHRRPNQPHRRHGHHRRCP